MTSPRGGTQYWNTVSKIDEIPIPHFMIGHAYVKLCPSRMLTFVYLKYVCTSNQLQRLQENVRSRIYQYNRWKSLVIVCNSNFIIDSNYHLLNLYSLHFFALQIVLTCFRQVSANERYRNTVKDLLLLNTVSQKDENPHTSGLQEITCKRSMMFLPE